MPSDIGGAPTYATLKEQLGENNLLVVDYDRTIVTDYDKWKPIVERAKIPQP